MVETRSAFKERIKLFVGRYGRICSLLLLIIGIFLLIYIFSTGVPTETYTETSSIGSISVDQSTSAKISTNESILWEKNQTVTENSVYPVQDAPVINFRLNSTQTGGEKLTLVAYRNTTVYSSNDNSEIWSTTQRISSKESQSPNLEFELDVKALQEFNSELVRRYGSDISVEHRLVLVTSLETENRQYVSKSDGIIQIHPKTYSVPSVEISDEFSDTTQKSRINEDEVYSIGGFLLVKSDVHLSVFVVLSVLLSAFIYQWQGRISIPDAERELVHQRYSVYISEVDGPISCGQPDETVQSLKQLIDFAINTDSQVIYGRLSGIYYAKDDNIVLAFDPDGEYTTDEFGIALSYDGSIETVESFDFNESEIDAEFGDE